MSSFLMPVAGLYVLLACAGDGLPPLYHSPGDLVPGSGDGVSDGKVWAPGIRFPIELASWANSQVYNPGGMHGGAGGQCAVSNYSWPWRDNFCERRRYDNPMCSAGSGHQGQDVRPSACTDRQYWAVAAEDGTVTHLAGYVLTLRGTSGRLYKYLHMADVAVSVGDVVQRGDNLGTVSNQFGGTPTTIHLHFEIWDVVVPYGFVPVPPYSTLQDAHERLRSGTP